MNRTNVILAGVPRVSSLADASQRPELDELNDSAGTKGTVSTIGSIAGAVLIASGVVFLLTAPK